MFYKYKIFVILPCSSLSIDILVGLKKILYIIKMKNVKAITPIITAISKKLTI